MRRRLLGPGVAAAADAMTEHHFIALAPTLDHLQNDFGRILQIGIDRHHNLPVGDLQSRRQRRLFAEVTAQIDDAQPRVVPLTIQQPLKCGISAAVIDEHQLQSN